MLATQCSIRALQTCVRDTASFHIRQCRAHSFFRQCRKFSTRPVRGHPVATTPVAHVDDTAVPFEYSKGAERGDRILEERSIGKAKDTGVKPDDEWHAEIELESPALREASEASQADGRQSAIAFEDREPSQEHGRNDGGLAMTQKRILDDYQASPESAVQRSRTESRKQRKLRRMAAGIYRATSEARSGDEEAQSQMDTVLAKLDEMEDHEQSRQQFDGQQTEIKSVKKKTSSEQQDQTNQGRLQSDQTSIQSTKSKSNQPGQTETRTSIAEKTARKPKREDWQIQKEALERKFGEQGWQPRKRLSPDTLEGIRALHASDPASYSTETLSEHFKVTPDAIRRILKSKWRPSDEEAADRRTRWERRGVKKWAEMAEQGIRPPAKWRAMGVGSPTGVKEDRVPSRRRKMGREFEGGEHLSWDDVVRDAQADGRDGSLAERLL